MFPSRCSNKHLQLETSCPRPSQHGCACVSDRTAGAQVIQFNGLAPPSFFWISHNSLDARRLVATMIIYVAVCRAKDAAIMAEFSEGVQGNAPQVTASLMEHLRDNPEDCNDGERKTFVQRNEADTDFFSNFMENFAVALGDTEGQNEEHYFHLYKMAGIHYCCLADDPDLRNQNVYVGL